MRMVQETKESNQEVEAPIKVYQWQQVLDGGVPTSIRKFQQLRNVPMYFKEHLYSWINT